MSKRQNNKKRFSKKKGDALGKRVKKLEEDLEPILKTFEQRIVDMPTAAAGQTNMAGRDVSVGNGGYFLEMGKYAPTTQENQYTSAPGSVQNYLPQNLRIGDKITLKSLRIRGNVKCALGSATGDATNQMRIMAVLIKDWSSISAGATAGTLLQTVLQNYGTGYSPQAPMYSPYKAYQSTEVNGNQYKLNSYKVLWDKKFNLVNSISSFTGGVGSGGLNNKESWRHDFDINLKFPKGLVCQYDQNVGAGNNPTSPAINNIVILAVSDSTISGHPTVSYTTRMRYIDA